MNNIVGLDGQPKAAPERTYDYQFTTRDGEQFTQHGTLTMNPMFYGTVDEDNKMTFSIASELVKMVVRLEPRKLNS